MTLISPTAAYHGHRWYPDGAWNGTGQPTQLNVVQRCLRVAVPSRWTLVTHDLTVPGGDSASASAQ